MAPFRLARPRIISYLILEGALIFAVLYGLALLVPLISPAGAQVDFFLPVLLVGSTFTVLLLLTQYGTPGDQANLTSEIVVFSVLSLALGAVGVGASWLFFGQNMAFSTFVGAGAVAVPVAVSLWRWASVHFSMLNATRENVVIVGTGVVAQQVCQLISAEFLTEYALLGFADETDERIGSVVSMGSRVQTDFNRLPEFAAQRADRVIVALDEKRGKLPVRQLMELRLRGLEIEDATSFIERVCGKISVESMLPSWLIFSDGFRTSLLRSFLKRLTDITHSLATLIVTSPVMLVTAVAIRVTSPGPILYRQKRLGMNGHEFEVLKFRSMRQDAEGLSGPQWASENDPRVTFVGRVIRATRIDELPQLINILRGDMSFVGPRPERAHFVRQLERRLPYYTLRMTVRPGLTGWAQVEYGYGATEEDALEKLKYDLYYIKNSNVFFDLWIVIKTTKVVLSAWGAR
jgi:sugar transferase (PEP-CTERM system associated)